MEYYTHSIIVYLLIHITIKNLQNCFCHWTFALKETAIYILYVNINKKIISLQRYKVTHLLTHTHVEKRAFAFKARNKKRFCITCTIFIFVLKDLCRERMQWDSKDSKKVSSYFSYTYMRLFICIRVFA